MAFFVPIFLICVPKACRNRQKFISINMAGAIIPVRVLRDHRPYIPVCKNNLFLTPVPFFP